MEQFSLKGKKGITLIALVVTIIILIILASISINALSGDDGIINKAQSARLKSENSAVVEGVRLKVLKYQADFNDKIKEQLLSDGVIDENGVINTYKLLNQNISTGQGSENDVYVIEDNNLYYYDKKGNKTDLGYIADIETIEYVIADSTLFNVSNAGVLTLKNHDSYYEGGQLYGTIKNLEIPNQIDGKEIKEIGGYCFESISTLKNVKIPDSVTTIGYEAFKFCTSLTSVNIPDSVTTISYSAFSDCTSLESINIPSSVTTIGGYAFSSCYSLTSINIPDSVTTIGKGAFSNCTSLESIEVSENDKKYSSDEGILYTKDKTEILQYPAGKKGNEYNIPSSVTTIGTNAFYRCTSLESINIPNSVTTIESVAFAGCTSLTSINMPDSVTTIGASAFSDCTSLISINIPDSVTTIEISTFSGCTSLTSINIPDSVIEIGHSAFYYCTSLTSINIPSSVTKIRAFAFWNCTSLASINIPSSVTEINENVFTYWTSKQTINIQSSSVPSGWSSSWKSGCNAKINYGVDM